MSTRQAAAELDVSESTVRAWIRAGAPTVRLGSEGRGRGSRVVVADLQRRRRAAAAAPAGMSAQDVLSLVARRGAAAARRAYSGDRTSRHSMLKDAAIAALVIDLYRDLEEELLGRRSQAFDLPPELQTVTR